MGKQVVELQTVLMKLQSVFGTAETTLTSADYIEPAGPTLDFDVESTPMDTVGGGFSQAPSVMGQQRAMGKFSFPFRYGGAEDNPGDIGKALQVCGFAQSGPTSHAFTWSPANSGWKDATIWGYSGSQESAGAILDKVFNYMANGTINLDVPKGTVMLELDGIGGFDAEGVASTQPTDVTRCNWAAKALKGATVSILGNSDYSLISATIEFTQDITPTTALNTSGVGVVIPAKRKIKVSMKVYRELPATTAPVTALLAHTIGATSFAWGAVPQLWGISITAMQFDKVTRSEQNGVETYDISGPVINNAMSITLDTTTA